jgi:hypothetical protein
MHAPNVKRMTRDEVRIAALIHASFNVRRWRECDAR